MDNIIFKWFMDIFENVLFLVENIKTDKKGLFWAFELDKV